MITCQISLNPVEYLDEDKHLLRIWVSFLSARIGVSAVFAIDLMYEGVKVVAISCSIRYTV